MKTLWPTVLAFSVLSCIPGKRQLDGLRCDVFDVCLSGYRCVAGLCVVEQATDASLISDAVIADSVQLWDAFAVDGRVPDGTVDARLTDLRSAIDSATADATDSGYLTDGAQQDAPIHDVRPPDLGARRDTPINDLTHPDQDTGLDTFLPADTGVADRVTADRAAVDQAYTDSAPLDSSALDSSALDSSALDSSALDSSALDGHVQQELPAPLLTVNFEDCAIDRCFSIDGMYWIASILSSPLVTAPGHLGQGAVINLGTHLLAQPCPSIAVLNEGTLTQWIQLTGGSSTVFRVVEPTGHRQLSLSVTNGAIMIDARETFTPTDGGGTLTIPTIQGVSRYQSSIGDFAWHHLAYRSGVDGHAIFVDGIPIPMNYSSGHSSTPAFVGWVGAESKLQVGADMVGSIDDVRIYSEALGDDQIKLDQDSNR